ncbi:mevalonate kinase [Candidatus Daviesbacteria bacterium]|nr:mevalonate kinase [Candidatus Daviesbacteria bacterium]
MKTITVSAPGKLMLLGEHAVVYGRPCIVTAVNQRMKATVELTDEPIFSLDAPDVQVTGYQKPMDQLGVGDPLTPLAQKDSTSIPKGAKFVEIALYNFYNNYKGYTKKGGIRVTTKSEFSSQFGFGSSSASTVCVIKALSEITGANLDNKTVFDLSYKTVLDIQGKGSGFDVAAAIYGGTLYFKKGGEIIEPLNVDSLPLIVGYSGIKADTVTLMNQVLEKDQLVVEGIYTDIGKLVEQAKPALLNKDWATLGKLMDDNQKLLSELGVSIPKLDQMISAATNAGAYGVKLSGAGGGDCMITLAPEDKIQAVKDGIAAAGGQVIEVGANVEGVKVENG